MEAQYYKGKNGQMICKPAGVMVNVAIAKRYPNSVQRGLGCIPAVFDFLQRKMVYNFENDVNRYDNHTWYYNSYLSLVKNLDNLYSEKTIKRALKTLEKDGIILSRCLSKELKYNLHNSTKFYSMDDDFLTKNTEEVLQNKGVCDDPLETDKGGRGDPLSINKGVCGDPLLEGDTNSKKEDHKGGRGDPLRGVVVTPLQNAEFDTRLAKKQPFSESHTVKDTLNPYFVGMKKKFFPSLTIDDGKEFLPFENEFALDSKWSGPRLPDSPNLAVTPSGKFKLILPTYETISNNILVKKILEGEKTFSYLDLMDKKKIELFLQTYKDGHELEAITFFWTKLFEDLEIDEMLKTMKGFTPTTLIESFQRDAAKHFPWGMTWVSAYQTKEDRERKSLYEYLETLKAETKIKKGFGDKSIDRLDQLIRKAFNKPMGFAWAETYLEGRKALALMVKMINKRGEYDFWGRIRKLTEDEYNCKNIIKLTSLYYKTRSLGQESNDNEAFLYVRAIGSVKVDDYGMLVEDYEEKTKRLKKYGLYDIIFADPEDKENSDEYIRKGNLALSKWADESGLKKLQGIMEKEGIKVHYPFRSVELPRIVENK